MSEISSKLKKNQRKESILESALEEFTVQGFNATTMRSIAKAEGISETLLYRFFKNKEEILLTIVVSKISETAESMQEIFETTKGMIPDPKQTLHLIWKMMQKRLARNKELLILLQKEHKNLREIFQSRGSFKETIQEHMQGKSIRKIMENIQVSNTLTEYFQRCKDAGNLREDLEPKHCTAMFLKLIWVPMLPPNMPFSGIMPEYSEKEIDEFLEQQMDIFLYGIASK